ncbi:MAG: cobalt-precorrin-5B (C(1))-methyltransferase, partial [Nitrospirae bacterium]|nr:cobalt-precorrin-5B (C(1))-methyltransferase [Nitrospirota bacterium]
MRKGTKSVNKKELRSGYTTGACAAAAAKAAALLLDEQCRQSNVGARRALPLQVEYVDIPFPDGSRVKFKIHNSKLINDNSELTARASVIKDAGDDPDVTNGAEIVAEAKLKGSGVRGQGSEMTRIIINGGKGVGTITKPGLSVPIGEAAINPVPRNMIKEAVMEAITAGSGVRGQGSSKNESIANLKSLPLAPCPLPLLEITISVPNGEELAKKTLNHRLGIVGGISILGTTGIVRPVSTEAWTATIASSMDVAKAMGHKEIVISAGRSSEKAHMKKYKLPEEVYVLMGDYLEYSLKEAVKHGFKNIHLCAQWAKMVKIAMATPQTHV